MIEEAPASATGLAWSGRVGVACESALRFRCLLRITTFQRIGFVTHPPPVNRLAHETVALIIVHRGDRPVNGYLLKVRSPQTDQLCIGIREQAALQQGI